MESSILKKHKVPDIVVPIIYLGETLLNKLELIQEIKDKCGLIGHEATQLVNIFFSELANALANGDRVRIRGFCSFFIKKYEGYTERNP